MKLITCFLLLFFPLTVSIHAQEYLYPNRLLSDRGLIEYRPYTLEEARAYETGGFVWDPPFLTDWGPERRLTDQTVIYTARVMAVGETLLCAYDRIEEGQTYFIRSTDGGDNWEGFVSLGDSALIRNHYFPELARDGSKLLLGGSIFQYFQPRGYNLGYFRSTDLGASWGPIQTVFSSYRQNQSNYASLANCGETLYFAYNEYDHDSLYVVRSTDWGLHWGGRGANVAYLGGTLQNMTLRASGGVLHLVWVNEVGTINVRYSRSTDGGLSWSPEIDIAEDPRGAQWACVAAEGSHVVVSWMGYRYSSYGFTGDYFIRQSFDHGASWDSAQVLTDSHYVQFTSVFVRDSLIIATWQDFRFDEFGDDEAMAMFSADLGRSWSPEERLSFGNYHSHAPVACATPGKLHVLWGDQRTAAQGLYYCRNDLLTSIDEDSGGGILPEKKVLLFAYPNPFNSSVVISYSTADKERGNIVIYNIQGQLVKTFNIHGKEGSVVWDARDSNGSSLASGIYFAKMSASGNDIARKLLYLK